MLTDGGAVRDRSAPPLRSQYSRFGQRLSLCLTMATLAAGCASVAELSSSQTSIGPIEEAFLLNSDVILAADRLKQTTVQVCMSERGYRYDMQTMSSAAAAALAITKHLDNALVLSDWYGFRDAQELIAPPMTTVDPNEQQLQAMSEHERAAFLRALNVSTPTLPSCMSRGESAFADAIVGPATQRLGELYGDLLVEVGADRNVIAAQSRWKECMRALGHDFANRAAIVGALKDEAVSVAALSSGARDARVDELVGRAQSLAQADVGCDETAGLESTTREVQHAAEVKLAAAEAQLLESVAEERSQLLDQGGGD